MENLGFQVNLSLPKKLGVKKIFGIDVLSLPLYNWKWTYYTKHDN